MFLFSLPLTLVHFVSGIRTALSTFGRHIAALLVRGILVLQNVAGAVAVPLQTVLHARAVRVAAEDALYWQPRSLQQLGLR